MVSNLIKSKLLLHILSVLRNTIKMIEVRTYKLQLPKSFLKKIYGLKKKLKDGNFTFFEEEYLKKNLL